MSTGPRWGNPGINLPLSTFGDGAGDGLPIGAVPLGAVQPGVDGVPVPLAATAVPLTATAVPLAVASGEPEIVGVGMAAPGDPAAISPAGKVLRTSLLIGGMCVAVLCVLGTRYSDAIGIWWPYPSSERPDIALAAAVAVVVALAQLLQMRIRTGGTEIGFAWGEAAVIVAYYFLPVDLVPAVFFSGVLVARLIELGLRRWMTMPTAVTTFSSAVTNASVLTIAATIAGLVVVIVGVEPGMALDPVAVVVLSSAATGYFLVSLSIVAGQLVTSTRERYWPSLRRMVWSKAPMVIGNMAISMAALAALSVDPWWMTTLPPVLWLLHQTYTFRLRADDERRTWQVFAETTRELNHVDERAAATAGLRGARTLFGTAEAAIVIDGTSGGSRVYAMRRDGTIAKVEPPTRCATRVAAARPLLVGGVRVGELRLCRASRLTKRDLLMLAAYGDALAAVLHDAATNSELRALAERSSYDAVHDGLTGLANRASLLVHGTAALRSLDAQAPVALLLLDINHFKEVNTTLGHAAGDELLRVAATRLAAACLPGEMPVRLGGDEFALLLTNATAPLPYAIARARHLTEELALPTEVAGVQLSVEASIGVVAAAAGAVDMTELLRRADIAMYQAKRDGPSVAWYDPDRDDASTDRLALLAELREALNGGEQVDVLLQPVVALVGGHPVGVEALARWQHPRRGTLKPVDFVRVVEQSELLGQFTRCVLDRALAAARSLVDNGLPLPVAVNLSPRSLHDRQLPSDVAHLLILHRVPAELLVLEIIETVVLKEDKVVDEVLAALRSLGIRLAVDDFGTGCSALTFLTRVPVDEVKIDRSFVMRMVDSPEAAAIVRTTVELGRELGLEVVAEGVETVEQRRALIKLGCPSAQGFHFYPLMPVAMLIETLCAARAAPVPRLTPAD